MQKVTEMLNDDVRAKTLAYDLDTHLREVDRLVSLFRNRLGQYRAGQEKVSDYVDIYPRCDSITNLMDMVAAILGRSGCNGV